MDKITEEAPFVQVKRELPGPWTDARGQMIFTPRLVLVCRGCDGRGWSWVGSAFDPDEPTQEPCETCDMTGEVMEGTHAADNLLMKARAYAVHHGRARTYGQPRAGVLNG